ncbi:MAG: hypothetical protein ACLFP1_07540 [Candidatus Goldiibacteriota bacterium]
MYVDEFVDNLGVWMISYRENKDKVESDENEKSAEQKKWEDDMMKIASAFTVPEEFSGTAGWEYIRKFVETAKEKDRTKLKELYETAFEIEKFIGG